MSLYLMGGWQKREDYDVLNAMYHRSLYRCKEMMTMQDLVTLMNQEFSTMGIGLQVEALKYRDIPTIPQILNIFTNSEIAGRA